MHMLTAKIIPSMTNVGTRATKYASVLLPTWLRSQYQPAQASVTCVAVQHKRRRQLSDNRATLWRTLRLMVLNDSKDTDAEESAKGALAMDIEGLPI